MQVKDEDIGTDKKLGITSIPLAGLKPDEEEEITKNLAVSLDRDRVKDKGDRGSITIKVCTKLCLCSLLEVHKFQFKFHCELKSARRISHDHVSILLRFCTTHIQRRSKMQQWRLRRKNLKKKRG